MNSPATARSPGRSRLALIVAGVLVLLGSFVVTATAQAGYYGDSYYGSNPCYDRCGYPRYRYVPPYRYNGFSPCGCYRRCHSYSRPSLVYERRYVEREYYERRYGWGGRHYRHCGYYSCEGRPYYRSHYGDNPYGGYRRPYPYGYGGVRSWRGPYGSLYQPSAERYGDGYEEPPRPPAPVWGGAGYEADPDGY